MKILILGPNKSRARNWGHDLFKKEIARQHNVTFYGFGYPDFNSKKPIDEVISKFQKKGREFDFVLTYMSKWVKDFVGFDNVKIPKVNITIDYFEPTKDYTYFASWTNIDNILKKENPDLIFAVTTKTVRDLKRNLNFDKIFYLPFSVDTNIYKNLDLPKTIDIMACFADYADGYKNRSRIKFIARQLKNNMYSKTVLHQQYVDTINKSKIFINANNDYDNSLSMKYSECLACGTFFLTDKPEDFDLLGYEDKKHLVLYNDFKDFKRKLKYYLNHDEIRERIAKNGMKFIRKHHSCEVRVQQMIKVIKEELNI